MQHLNLEELRIKAEPVIRQAGQMLREQFGADSLVVERKKDGSYVTAVDLASERILKEGLQPLLPEAGFFAEESGQSGNSELEWVIDPLDGTTNFVHGLPYWCVSVALTIKQRPVLAFVYQPLLDQLFWAVEGQGAYCNEQRMHISHAAQLQKTLVVIGLPYSRDRAFAQMLAHVPSIATQTYSFRYFGAAALDQAYVAKGSLDGICFPRLGWWDIAAGMLLIKEAGGILTDFQGKTLDAGYESYVAGSAQVHAELLEILKMRL